MPLAADIAMIGFSACHRALHGEACLLAASWCQQAPLPQARSLSAGPAVYSIHDGSPDEPDYIGETSSLVSRAVTHAATPWPLAEPTLAVLRLPAGTPKHVLRELESDLLGWHFAVSRRAPALQYAEAIRKGARAISRARAASRYEYWHYADCGGPHSCSASTHRTTRLSARSMAGGGP